jgi:hypothetical protein
MFQKAKLLLVALATATPAVAGFGEVVSSFELPRPLPGSGLAWDGEYLWVCGEPHTYFFRLTTSGSVVFSFNMGGTYGYYHGATFDGQYLWADSYRFPDEFTELGRYTTTGSYVGGFAHFYSWRGLAWEKGYLWLHSRKLTTAGSLVASFKSPMSIGDLAWDGHYLWNGNYQITTKGSLVASFSLPGGGRGSGTTFDGLYLWTVGPNRWVYQVDIDVQGVNPGSFGKIKGLFR